MAWRLVEHTADVAIEAEGSTQGAAMESAALALTSILCEQDEPHRLAASSEITFELEAPDDESLLVAFLAELLWLGESKDLLWLGGGVEVTTTDDGLRKATVTGNGALHSEISHGRGTEVKAVTYHDLLCAGDTRGWKVRVLLDI